jgi:GH18 family chitinase
MLLAACTAPGSVSPSQNTNIPLPITTTPSPITAIPSPIQSPNPIPTSKPTAIPRPFRVIGYATDAINVETIPFAKLTHINYAFLIPNGDGSFAAFENASKVKTLVQLSHQNNVKVLISIGGWGWDAQFEEIAADPLKRAAFVNQALKVVDEYEFDGIDVDWEYPDPGKSAQNYLELIRELRTTLPDKLLTTAVISSGDETGLGIPTETFALLDFINVMTYDEPGHASMEQFQTGLDYWLGRGVPPEKLVMGIPFYSRPGEIPFRKLVQNDPAAAQTDSFNYNGSQEHYNGLATVQKKTSLALEKASGIMFWTLEQDADGNMSLLNAINQTINAARR